MVVPPGGDRCNACDINCIDDNNDEGLSFTPVVMQNALL